MIDSRTAGSRYATRVRIASPVGSCYDGRVGTVVEERSDVVIVRLDPTRRQAQVAVGFGRCEIKEIAR